MTFSTTRIIIVALAILALAAPVAAASPMKDGSPPLVQDHSRPDTRGLPTPAPKPHHTVVAADNGTSPLVYVVPIVVLAALLSGAALLVRSSRQPLRA
jgi:hypothetical protein